MKSLKKVLGVFIFMMAMVLLPKSVFAKASYDVTNMKIGETDYMSISYDGDYITFYVGNTGDFSFRLTTTDLTDDKTYTVKLTSDYMNESYDYTGAELNAGVDIAIPNAKSYVEIAIVEKGTKNEVNYKYVTTCFPGDQGCTPETHYLPGVFYFSDEIDTSDIDEFYNKTFKNGKAKVDTIKVGDSYALNSALTISLKKYETERFYIEDVTYEPEDPTRISITDTTRRNHTKTYPITYEYATVDASKKAKVDEIIKQFNQSFEKIEDKLFVIEDLENINFKYATRNIKNEEHKINMAVNYSSKLHELLGNNNMSVAADTRMGWDSDITAGAAGYLSIMYDGVIYAVVDAQGTIQKNVIYVPDGTTKNRQAYIDAAKSRIKKYLPEAKIEIVYGGQIEDLTIEELGFDPEEIDGLVEVDKTLGEYYNLTLDSKTFKFFIAEGSDHMNEPFLKTKDLDTNIYVETSSSLAPLDSKINATILDKDSEEYKNLMSKLKITDGLSVDIKLFSKSQNVYVSKLNNGKFKVYIPVDSSYNGKKLVAYYVKEDGSIEEHEVTVEDGFAIFETDHFSTYTLAEKEETTTTGTTEVNEPKTTSTIKNPKTSDSILTYTLTLIVSLIGITFIVLYLKRIKMLKND